MTVRNCHVTNKWMDLLWNFFRFLAKHMYHLQIRWIMTWLKTKSDWWVLEWPLRPMLPLNFSSSCFFAYHISQYSILSFQESSMQIAFFSFFYFLFLNLFVLQWVWTNPMKHEESTSTPTITRYQMQMSRKLTNTRIFSLSFSFIFSLCCLLSIFYSKLCLVHGTGGQNFFLLQNANYSSLIILSVFYCIFNWGFNFFSCNNDQKKK